MLTLHGDFPVRPKMMEGESLAGYIKRFYFSNGYPAPQQIKRTLRDLYAGEAIEEPFRLLQEVVGESGGLDRSYWVTRRLDAPSSTKAVPKWRKLGYDKPKFCPACLELVNFHFGIWELPMFHACPVHRCMLLLACSSCGRYLTWASMALGWHCQCGVSIKSMPTATAPTWAIDLSTLMVRAADAQIPNVFARRKLAMRHFSSAYSLNDIFDALAWAYDLRKTLTKRERFRVGMWPPRLKPSARVEPGAWEARLLADSPAALSPFLKRLFKWNFRGRKPSVLVCSVNDSLQLALHGLSSMPASKHLFAAMLHQCADFLLGEHRALPPKWNVYFHPNLSHAERISRVSMFADWWYTLSNRINLLEPDAVLLANSTRRRHLHEFFGTNSTEQVVAILNELIDCAVADIRPDRFWKLIRRWHVPAKLRRHMKSDEVLAEIVGYFEEITVGERSFFLALLTDET